MPPAILHGWWHGHALELGSEGSECHSRCSTLHLGMAGAPAAAGVAGGRTSTHHSPHIPLRASAHRTIMADFLTRRYNLRGRAAVWLHCQVRGARCLPPAAHPDMLATGDGVVRALRLSRLSRLQPHGECKALKADGTATCRGPMCLRNTAMATLRLLASQHRWCQTGLGLVTPKGTQRNSAAGPAQWLGSNRVPVLLVSQSAGYE